MKVNKNAEKNKSEQFGKRKLAIWQKKNESES